jgi:hypothetical protein
MGSLCVHDIVKYCALIFNEASQDFWLAGGVWNGAERITDITFVQPSDLEFCN